MYSYIALRLSVAYAANIIPILTTTVGGGFQLFSPVCIYTASTSSIVVVLWDEGVSFSFRAIDMQYVPRIAFAMNCINSQFVKLA